MINTWSPDGSPDIAHLLAEPHPFTCNSVSNIHPVSTASTSPTDGIVVFLQPDGIFVPLEIELLDKVSTGFHGVVQLLDWCQLPKNLVMEHPEQSQDLFDFLLPEEAAFRGGGTGLREVHAPVGGSGLASDHALPPTSSPRPIGTGSGSGQKPAILACRGSNHWALLVNWRHHAAMYHNSFSDEDEGSNSPDCHQTGRKLHYYTCTSSVWRIAGASRTDQGVYSWKTTLKATSAHEAVAPSVPLPGNFPIVPAAAVPQVLLFQILVRGGRHFYMKCQPSSPNNQWKLHASRHPPPEKCT
ncbi:hypothetical protein RLOC_00000526 [Lonchura striata]|uniref:Uncharacterized protein n=1 Tax=Lonchura striata TaxID=40157 RepID=A0A218V4G8_9PASE|nr:hypothetical protein RLOC_00000526 [Lonchura striata domestica]